MRFGPEKGAYGNGGNDVVPLKFISERRVGASIEPSKSLFRNDKLAAAPLLSANEESSTSKSTGKQSCGRV